MSVESRYPIRFGERMTEKDCQLLGHIGQIGIMASLGKMLDDGGSLPGCSADTDVVRNLCKTLHRGDFLEAARRLSAHTVPRTFNDYTIPRRLGMTCENKELGQHVLSTAAMTAFRFHARETHLLIPEEFEAPFEDLVEYYTERTHEEIVLRAEAVANDSNAAVEPIGRRAGDIAYEVRYLEASL